MLDRSDDGADGRRDGLVMGAASGAAARSQADEGGIFGCREVSEAEELIMTEPLMGFRRGETIPRKGASRHVDGNG